jgi:PAS domain S-box-containing protein
MTHISKTNDHQHELQRLADEQAALRRVATLVSSDPAPSDVFAAVVQEAGQLLRVPLISMVRYEPNQTATVIAALHEEPFPIGTNWELDGPSVMASVLETGRSVRVDDYRDVPGSVAERAWAAGIRSALGVPIVVDGRTWGAMVAVGPGARRLPSDTEARLSNFTELVAASISNTQARDDLRLLAEEQAALRRVATMIAREATAPEVFATVAQEVAQTLDVPLTAVVRYEDDGTATQVGAWGSQNPFPVGTTWTLDDQSVSGLVSRTGRPARVGYADVEGEIAGTLARSAGISTAAGVPITVEGRLWGVMMALSTEERPLPPDTETRLASFTELVGTSIANADARAELRRLADEQSALRRVATLVARGTDSRDVFDAVCAETGRLIGASSVNLAQFTSDGANLTVAGWSLRETHVPPGTRLPLAADTINGRIRDTGKPARFDSYEGASGELARLIQGRGIRSEVGAPVIVEGQTWGALIAGTDGDDALPARTENRVARFAELIATAVANATARSELIASRARLVSAGDEARRRIERNLHDGTQQRLVALGLDLQTVAGKLPRELAEERAALDRVTREIESVLDDVRELSRGLHPALLSQAGLAASLRALARASPIPVELDVRVDQRPAEPIEVAVYYVISEALTNAAKYSSATKVSVTATTGADRLSAIVHDDGIGGAEASAGSGLVGLIDRTKALGGRFVLESPPGHGTRISVDLPLTAPPTTTPAITATLSGHTKTVEPLLEEAVAAVPDALYVVDPQGRIKFVNPAVLRILGYENESQLLGRPSHDTIHYVRRDGTPFPAAECPLLRPRTTGETVRVDEDWFVRQDGSLVCVAYASAPILLNEGRGAVVSFRELPNIG